MSENSNIFLFYYKKIKKASTPHHHKMCYGRPITCLAEARTD